MLPKRITIRYLVSILLVLHNHLTKLFVKSWIHQTVIFRCWSFKTDSLRIVQLRQICPSKKLWRLFLQMQILLQKLHEAFPRKRPPIEEENYRKLEPLWSFQGNHSMLILFSKNLSFARGESFSQRKTLVFKIKLVTKVILLVSSTKVGGCKFKKWKKKRSFTLFCKSIFSLTLVFCTNLRHRKKHNQRCNKFSSKWSGLVCGNFLLQREDVFEEKLREASAKEFASERRVVKAY